MALFDELGNMVMRDSLSLFLGPFIGGGAGRQVYEYALDSDYVVKIETRARSFQNAYEVSVWDDLKMTRWAKWLAPVEHISACGMWLLQRKTEPIPKGKYPKRIPNFMTDLKYSNFGVLDGKFVAHDYGMNLLNSNALNSAKLIKADWWE